MSSKTLQVETKKSGKATGRINANQRVFIDEYINNNFNAAAAYRIAYNKHGGEDIYGSAYRLINLPQVRDAIAERISIILGSKETFATKCLNQLNKIAFSANESEYFDSNAKLRAIDLIQKQFNLQSHTIEANISSSVVIISGEDSIED